MRINKYIANSGIASRRKADELIKNGKVKVNGSILGQPGYDVKPGDKVCIDGKEIESRSDKVYYIMNKPLGVITSVSDDRGRMTVVDIVSAENERIFPVGRLDYNTSGLLFLTNDGEMANRIMHPGRKIPKTYRVRVAGHINKTGLSILRSGVRLKDFTTSAAKIDVITWNRRSMLLEVTIHEGKNRQIRRMFEAIGYPVQELERISVGNIKLGHLKQGEYRKLRKGELEYLKTL